MPYRLPAGHPWIRAALKIIENARYKPELKAEHHFTIPLVCINKQGDPLKQANYNTTHFKRALQEQAIFLSSNKFKHIPGLKLYITKVVFTPHKSLRYYYTFNKPTDLPSVCPVFALNKK